MQKGNTLVIVLVLVAVLVVGGVVAFMMTQSQGNPTTETGEMEHSEEMTVDESQDQATDSPDADDANAVVVNVSARNFSYNPTEIRVKRGDTVKIVLNVEAGMHDWVVDEFDARTDVVSTGETTEVTFIADQAGEFEYYCSVGNHRQMGMVGTLIVEE
jgi:plastocyanin